MNRRRRAKGIITGVCVGAAGTAWEQGDDGAATRRLPAPVTPSGTVVGAMVRPAVR